MQLLQMLLLHVLLLHVLAMLVVLLHAHLLLLHALDLRLLDQVDLLLFVDLALLLVQLHLAVNQCREGGVQLLLPALHVFLVLLERLQRAELLVLGSALGPTVKRLLVGGSEALNGGSGRHGREGCVFRSNVVDTA